MTLIPELQAAVDKAQAGDLQGLHQMILGPSPSGKTTQANAYAEALMTKGVTGSLRMLDINQIKFVGNLGQVFNEAKGGVLLIDELEKTEATQRREILSHVVRAVSDGDTLIIITGAVSLENDLAMEPALQRRMGPPVILDKKFTRAEMEAFKAAHNARRDAEHEMQEVRAQRMAEWKTATAEDLRPRKAYTAPKTARFRKPEVVR